LVLQGGTVGVAGLQKAVGIGTSTPTATLDVSGDALIQGDLNMSCNRIIDISGISFCSDASGIDLSCNPIRDVAHWI